MIVFDPRHSYRGCPRLGEGMMRRMIVSKAEMRGWLLGKTGLCGCHRFVTSKKFGLFEEDVLKGAIEACKLEPADRAAVETLMNAMTQFLSSPPTPSMEIQSSISGLDLFVNLNHQRVVNLEKLQLNGTASCEGGGEVGTKVHQDWILEKDFYGDMIISKVMSSPPHYDSSRIEFRIHVD
jgi:hypothetical protein